MPLPGGTAVPLPGSASAGAPVSLPGRGASSPAPVDAGASAPPLPGAGVVVPLPGGARAVPLPGMATGAVPLPGMATGFVPLPGMAKGSVPFPGMAAGAVPFPDMAAGSVPLPGMATGSVPLPGMAKGSVPLPGMATGSVPLPGMAKGSVALTQAASVALPEASAAFAFAAQVSMPALPPGDAAEMPSMDDIFGSDAAFEMPRAPPGKAVSMSDIFGDLLPPSTSPAVEGTNPVAISPASSPTALLDFIDAAATPDAAVKQEQFRVRRRSGRVLGPFDSQTILQMFARGELLGSEEGTADGVAWKPLGQIPAFSATIQKAMASALGGMEDLPVPFGERAAVHSTPRASHPPYADARAVEPPRQVQNGQQRAAPVDALNAELYVGTGDLLQAEKAKEEVERRRRTAREGGSKRNALLAVSGLLAVALIGLLGVVANFATPWGWFGYKLVFGDDVIAVETVAIVNLEAMPPPPMTVADVEPSILLRKDTYADYRQGAEQFGRIVEAKKGISPFPAAATVAAAEQARFLAYLTIIEEMPAFLPQLQTATALATGGDEVSVAIAAAAISYAQQNWDLGIAALKPFADPARSLAPARLSEVLTWWGLGLRGKGDGDGAMKKFDEALQSQLNSALTLSLQAQLLASSGFLEAALGYLDKVFVENNDHARARLLKGTLLAQTSTTVEEGKTVLADLSDGTRARFASPVQLALAFMGRAEIAISAHAYAEALRFVAAGVALAPQNRGLRLRAVNFAIRLRDYSVAREHAKALLALLPDDPDGTIGLARAKLGTRDTLGAYTDMQQALKKAPDSAALNFWFGVAAKEMGKAQEARTQFIKAQRLDPKLADPAVENILDAVERGKLSEALLIADAALESVSPGERSRVRSAKGYVYARRRQFSKADDAYTKALAESPRDSDTRARYAELLVAMDRGADAEVQVNEALLMDGKNPAVLIAAGDIAKHRGEFKQALDRYEEAMTLAPNAFEPYTRAAVVLAKLKDIPRAKGLIETAGQLRPNNPDVVSAQAQVISANEPKQAAALLQQAIEQAPEDPEIQYLLGITNQAMGQNVEAIDALKRATTLAPDYEEAWFALGKVDRDLGRTEEAKKCFGEVVRVNKKRADAWVQTADILASTGDDSGALDAYEKALRADPSNAESVCAMGDTLIVRMGEVPKNLKRGIEMLQRCVKLSPRHPSAWKNLGNAFKSERKNKQSIDAYQQHLLVNPHDPENSFVADFIADLTKK